MFTPLQRAAQEGIILSSALIWRRFSFRLFLFQVNWWIASWGSLKLGQEGLWTGQLATEGMGKTDWKRNIVGMEGRIWILSRHKKKCNLRLFMYFGILLYHTNDQLRQCPGVQMGVQKLQLLIAIWNFKLHILIQLRNPMFSMLVCFKIHFTYTVYPQILKIKIFSLRVKTFT